MIKKKIQTISIACFMLLAVLAIIPTVQAGQVHMIKGTLYFDGVVIGEGAQIKVNILTDTFYFDTFEPDINGYTFYLGGFDNDQYYNATAYLTVLYNSIWYTPIDNASIVLDKKNTNPYAEEYIKDLHIDNSSPINNPPNAPTLVAPSPSGTTVGGTTSATLKVSASDPDGDPMEVSFYNANGDVLLATSSGVANGGTASYSWTGLSPNTGYSWYAIANDGSLSTQSATWTFTTASGSSPPPGPGPGPGPTPPPSEDEDDDEILPNNPPVIVEFIGNLTGNKNTVLNYSATATDQDGHDVKYIFNWNDGTENETDFVANGTKYDITHMFTAAGVYDISVYAIDDYAEGGSPSAREYLKVLIDAHIIDDSINDVDGYLTDDDGDGIYDDFYNYNDESTTEVVYDSINGTYLIDTTGDGKYNYRYDPNTGLGELIEEDIPDDPAAGEPEPVEEDNTLLYVGVILLIIILLILFFLATRKKDKGKKGKDKK